MPVEGCGGDARVAAVVLELQLVPIRIGGLQFLYNLGIRRNIDDSCEVHAAMRHTLRAENSAKLVDIHPPPLLHVASASRKEHLPATRPAIPGQRRDGLLRMGRSADAPSEMALEEHDVILADACGRVATGGDGVANEIAHLRSRLGIDRSRPARLGYHHVFGRFDGHPVDEGEAHAVETQAAALVLLDDPHVALAVDHVDLAALHGNATVGPQRQGDGMFVDGLVLEVAHQRGQAAQLAARPEAFGQSAHVLRSRPEDGLLQLALQAHDVATPLKAGRRVLERLQDIAHILSDLVGFLAPGLVDEPILLAVLRDRDGDWVHILDACATEAGDVKHHRIRVLVEEDL
mmetsp:Transcript_100925/g.291899  ORF Transcript_100925/g.291899 Transcript_100925/m.291899 type:complete len:347 (-) Transcript_100925:255-1295(-)